MQPGEVGGRRPPPATFLTKPFRLDRGDCERPEQCVAWRSLGTSAVGKPGVTFWRLVGLHTAEPGLQTALFAEPPVTCPACCTVVYSSCTRRHDNKNWRTHREDPVYPEPRARHRPAGHRLRRRWKGASAGRVETVKTEAADVMTAIGMPVPDSLK